MGRGARRGRRGRHARGRRGRASPRSRPTTRCCRRSTPTGGLDQQRFTEDPPETMRGDPDAALASADVRVELTCETPAHVQTPLEPHAAVARWDGDELTAWVSTQGIFDARRELARRFGLDPEQVRVLAEYIGGGFGGKQGAGLEALLAAELARAAGRPVRLALDRHEDQVVGGRRAATRQTVTLGARSDGTLTADRARGGGRDGRRRDASSRSREPALSLYACPNVRTMTFPVKTSLRAQNAFRAPGVVEGVTVLEQAIDELAAKLELDPLELRRLNHVDRDQASGLPYSSKRLLACYDRAAELAGWGSPRARSARSSPTGCCAGWAARRRSGGAAAGRPRTRPCGSTPTAARSSRPGIQDIGTGTLTTARIVAAEELGLPLDRVVARGGDTGPNLYAPVSGGSMTTPAVMPAVRSAAGKARKLLLGLAADVLEIAADDLTLRDGRLRSSDGTLDVDVTEVTDKLGNATIDGSGTRGPNPGRLPREHVRLPDRAGRGRRGNRRRPRRAHRRRARRRSDRQPAHRREPGGGRRDPGPRLRAQRGAARRPDHRHAGQRAPRRLQGADDGRHAGDRRRLRRPARTRTCRTSARRASASRRSSPPRQRSRTRSRTRRGDGPRPFR